jgi:vancomycin resistance protein YoaR
MKRVDKKINIMLLGLGTVLCVYFLLLLLEGFIFNNRFGSGAKMAGVSVSFQTKSEAIKTISQAAVRYQKGQIIVDGVDYPVSSFLDKVDAVKSVEKALTLQQRNYFYFGPLLSKNYNLSIIANEIGISNFLFGLYNTETQNPVNAQIVLSSKAAIVPDKAGFKLLLPESQTNLINTLAKLGRQVDLAGESLPASFNTLDAEEMVNEAVLLTQKPFTFTSTKGNFTIPSGELENWVNIAPNEPSANMFTESLLPNESELRNYSYFDQHKVEAWAASLAAEIDQNATNASLAVVNGQVTVSAPDQDGVSLNQSEAVSDIENMTPTERTATLKITITKAAVRTDNYTSLGLSQLMSTGSSNFAGSPSNRIHNIQVGASKFNGVLISPHENFSFNQTLGPVDASTGYLPELVILQNQTVPQFGGGLCQVSTTAFRAALNAGFPILERMWHAYPVSYYKPYGTDATIYLPEPDLVFTNNTNSYVLIQTSISGNQLVFNFYGTKQPGSVAFSGEQNGTGSVPVVEQVNPTITDQNLRGLGSFTATFYRLVYNANGGLVRTDTFVSKYDSPSNYPH